MSSWEAKRRLLSPYFKLMRLDNLTGTFLLMWPSLWAVTMATTQESFFPYKIFFIFILGAFLMRSSGCIINDIVDRKLDAKVERTKDRPIASKKISLMAAIFLLSSLLLVSLILLLLLNNTTIIMGCLVIIPITIYPFMKRFTYWPQAFLALTFNWGVLMGWAAIRETIDLPAIMLYLAACCWTLGYDTIYALQDKKDDLLQGAKSTAIFFADNVKLYLYSFYILTNIFLWITAIISGLSLWFHFFLILSSFQLLWQVMTLDINDPIDCMKKFKTNRFYGALVLFAIIIGQV